ncbi:MAG TPA: T9SS type A sorting domain-containing protein [Cyclobacteriaceae bacterium]|nr:T9SS type A sorting domain-containing protein [Cyclobacteriaceae bacterium]
MRVLLGLLLWCCPFLVKSQFTYVIDQTIPVKNTDGADLSLPWAGGLNATQYNTLDINSDNKADLILFDRTANKVITFLNENDHYIYAPQYESLFPTLTNWLLLRDFNCDGRKDLFTGDILGISVYMNVSEPGEQLTWKKFLFYAGPGNPKSDVLLTEGFSGLINLQLQFDDLPSIGDLDGDGDIDILSMRYQGEGTVEFHQNFSKEHYGTCDSLEFERATLKWGNFIECECGVFAFNGTDCPPDQGGRKKHAGGKALLAMDIDNDLDQDLLFSEAECTELFLLTNVGNSENALFNNAELFPTNHPASFAHFPAPFYEDVDSDGVSDLLVTPNVFNKDQLGIDLKNSNWIYNNSGSQQLPSFTFLEKNFLQNQMIDVGDNSVPAFYDTDWDGDQDMIIGQNADAESLTGSVYFYKNTGTPTEPSFENITDDYLNIKSLFLYNVKPQFADADADGKVDLVMTATSIITGRTNLYYLANKVSHGVDFSDQLLNMVDFDMLYTENILMTDVDLDGINDILIGKSNGSVEYWKNNGPKGSFNFTLIDNTFAELGPSVERQSLGLASADLNADGKAELILGDQFGTLGIINDYRSGNEPGIVTNLIFNPFSDEYTVQNLGGRIWPTTANLFNTDRPAVVAGNIMGGVQVLRNDEGSSLPEEPIIQIYPIPVDQSELLSIMIDRYATVQVISLLGQELGDPVTLSSNQIYSFKVSNFASGLYILRILINGKTYSRRIVIN